MNYADLDLPDPIIYHPSMDILDSSKIQTFMQSPRKFFYRYILGWQGDEPNIHLIFGSAWHEAMEYLMINAGNYSDQVVMQAYDLFVETYRQAYPFAYLDDANGPKVPEKALEALMAYAVRYQDDSFSTEYTEIAGTIPLRLPDRLLHFKLDSIILDEDGYWSMEHKTTGNEFSWNIGKWGGQWGIKPQVWSYNHALRGLYGPEARGVKINGVLVSKRRIDFKRIPQKRPPARMQAGLDSMNHYVDQIDWNMERLQEDSVSEQTMFAFPCNGMACSEGYQCPFQTYCEAWPNPLQRAEEPPLGFKKEFWDPRRQESEAKKVVHLEKEVEQNANNG